MAKKVYQRIAELLTAIENCENNGNHEWKAKHKATLKDLVGEHMPSGSGFDNGTVLVPESTPNRLVFRTDYHHMDTHGVYDGWTGHDIIVKGDLLMGFTMRITGRNRNDIKDQIAMDFGHALNQETE